MPTNIPRKPGRPIAFFLFLAALFAACLALEVADPAPMDVDAASVAAP